MSEQSEQSPKAARLAAFIPMLLAWVKATLTPGNWDAQEASYDHLVALYGQSVVGCTYSRSVARLVAKSVRHILTAQDPATIGLRRAVTGSVFGFPAGKAAWYAPGNPLGTEAGQKSLLYVLEHCTTSAGEYCAPVVPVADSRMAEENAALRAEIAALKAKAAKAAK